MSEIVPAGPTGEQGAAILLRSTLDAGSIGSLERAKRGRGRRLHARGTDGLLPLCDQRERTDRGARRRGSHARGVRAVRRDACHLRHRRALARRIRRAHGRRDGRLSVPRPRAGRARRRVRVRTRPSQPGGLSVECGALGVPRTRRDRGRPGAHAVRRAAETAARAGCEKRIRPGNRAERGKRASARRLRVPALLGAIARRLEGGFVARRDLVRERARPLRRRPGGSRSFQRTGSHAPRLRAAGA